MFNKKDRNKNKEVTKTTSIPFLKRKEPITDLNSLFKRTDDLKHQIQESTERITYHESAIRSLKSDINFISMDTEANSNFMVFPSDYPELIENFRQFLITDYESKVKGERDMIHTCQDELDWLEMKVGLGPNLGKNMFETGSFNFDPYKDHC